MSFNNNNTGLRPVSMADSEKTMEAFAPENKKEIPDSAMQSESSSERNVALEPNQEKAEKNTGTVTAAETSADNTTPEDDFVYPKAWALAAIVLALCLAIFCMALDNTIIATAIPRITDQFKTLNDVGWYGSSYLLTTCAFQLIYGKIYTFYSIKWVFLFALFIFEVGSLICGVAPNSVTLIVGRAVAGLGAAGIFSGAILILANSVPLAKRPLYMGLVGGMFGIASVAGPLMGGAFTDHLTWRWCFYINLPFGAVTAAFILLFFRVPRRATKSNLSWKDQLRQLDLEGTAIFLPSVVCLLLALQWGGSKYEWKSGRIIALLVLFVVLMAGFVFIQKLKGEKATVPPRVFLNRNVWGSAWFMAMLGASFFCLVYFIPIWFQAIKSVSATKSGIMNIPMILGVVLMNILAGIAVTVIGYYTPLMVLSAILMPIGAGLLSTFTTTTGHPEWIGYQFLFGAGVGIGMQMGLLAVQSVLPDKDVAIGTAIMMFSQSLGGALFISVAQNVFTNGLIKHLHSVAPELDAQFVLGVGATEIKNKIEPQYWPGVRSAYNQSLVETFYVAAAVGAVSILGAVFVQWKSMKKDGKKVEIGAGAV